jgi:osmotically-inducible protein OsmY
MMYSPVMRYLAALFVSAFLLFPPPAAHGSPLPAREKQAISDDHIHDEVMRRLAADPEVKGGNLQVEVKDGVVTLRGQVDGPKAKAKAQKLVKKVRGVRSVADQLSLAR